MNLSPRFRLRLAAALLFGVVLLLGGLLWSLPGVVPVRIDAEQDGATVELSSPNVRTLFRHECVAVEWAVAGAQALTLNGAPVGSDGTSASCGGAQPTLRVTFDSGRSHDYRLPRVVVFDLPIIRLLLALALLAALAFAYFYGWFTPLYRRVSGWLNRRVPGLVADGRELTPLFRLDLREAGTLHTVAFFAIMLIAVGVRLLYINTPIGIDESQTYVEYVRAPLPEGLSNYSAPNNHIFHTFLAHLSVVLFGAQEWGLRFPAFIAGVLVIPLTYLVGLRLYNRSAALFATAFVVASVLLIEYSVNARGYSIGTALFLFQILLAWFLRVRRNRLGWVLFGLSSAFSLASIPTMLYAVAGVNVWLFLTILLENRGAERGVLLRRFFLAGVLTVLATVLMYAGVLAESGLEALVANRYVLPQGFRGVLKALPDHIVTSAWEPWHEDMPRWLRGAVLLGFGVGLLVHRCLSRSSLPLMLVVIAVSGVIVVIQRVLPLTRSWQFAIPLYFVVAAAGLLWLVGWLVPRLNRASAFVPALSLLTALGLTALVVADRSIPTLAPLPEARALVRALEPRLYTDDVVLLDPSYRPLRYYFVIDGLDREQVRNRNSYDAPGIYLVVQPGQTPVALLEVMKVDTAAYSEPVLIEQIGTADVYLLTREPNT